MSDLRRRRAVGEHALDQLADLAAQGHQLFDPLRAADGPGQVHQIDPLQGEQVTLGHHAAQALILDQADVSNVPLGHGNRRIEGAVIRRQIKR